MAGPVQQSKGSFSGGGTQGSSTQLSDDLLLQGIEANGVLGGLPVAEKNQEFFLIFKGVGGTGPEIIGQSAYFIEYLVDSEGNIFKPSENTSALNNLLQNFPINKPVNVTADEASAQNFQLAGQHTLTAIGLQQPILYSQIPTEMVSGQRLNQSLNDRAKFYETILDKEQIQILDAIGKISQGIEKRDEIAGVAGSLYAGGLYRQLLSDGMNKFSAAYELLKINLVSAALASKTIRKWGYRDVDWNEPKILYRGLLMSPPIIRAVFEDAADDQDAWLKIDAMRKEAGIKPQDEFMQGLMMEDTP